MFVYATCTEYNMLQRLAGNGEKRHKSASLWCVSVSFLELCLVYFSLFSSKKVQAMSSGCGSWGYVLWKMLLHPGITNIGLSGNNNHNKFILFQSQRRPEYIKCKVALLYYYYYIEIKASSCFHSVFLKSHCLYNYFNIQYLIKVKLLISALVFTISPALTPW